MTNELVKIMPLLFRITYVTHIKQYPETEAAFIREFFNGRNYGKTPIRILPSPISNRLPYIAVFYLIN